MSFPDLGGSPLRPQTSSTSSGASSGSQRSPSGRRRAGSVDPASPRRRPTPSQRAQAYYLRLTEQSIYEGGVLRAFQWKILHPDEPEARELFLQFRKMVSADVPYRERSSEAEKKEAGEMWAELTRIIASEIEERERKKAVSLAQLRRPAHELTAELHLQVGKAQVVAKRVGSPNGQLGRLTCRLI